jgi:uncharacterized lipoprotein NlpE involved in copper resistance
MRLKSFTAAVVGCAVVALALAGCDRQAAKPARSEQATADGTSQLDTRAERKAAKRAMREGRGGGGDADDGDVVDTAGIDASVRWAANRKKTAQEAVAKQFSRNGSDFGATSANDYAAKANAFVSNPPAGVKTAVRGNGDKLLYDPKSNTFAVVNRKGLPKTMFKPDDGPAYWTQQQATLNEYGKGRRNRQARNTGGSDDNG